MDQKELIEKITSEVIARIKESGIDKGGEKADGSKSGSKVLILQI